MTNQASKPEVSPNSPVSSTRQGSVSGQATQGHQVPRNDQESPIHKGPVSGQAAQGHQVPRVLTIAGTDPTGGAGSQADIKSIQAAGGYALAAITALVSQNTHGVVTVDYPDPATIRAQLDAISDDVEVDAVKIGMLGRVDYIETVRDWLVQTSPRIVVIDPVMVATSGDRLLDEDAEAALRDLLPLATVITPNTPELEVLAGLKPGTLHTDTDALATAQDLASELDILVTVKGGHLDGSRVINRLVGPEGIVATSSSPRIKTKNTHGTGCSMSSALATRLAWGDGVQGALSWVTDWLHESISNAEALHVGSGNGPIDHGHRARRLEKVAANVPWLNQTIELADLSEPLEPRAAEPDGGVGTPSIAPAGPWTQMLWDLSVPVMEQIWELPFIEGLRDDTLSQWDFTAYQRQDAFYLDRYAQALTMLAAKSHRPADRVHWGHGGAGAIEVEQALHRDWLSRHSDEGLVGAAQMAMTPVTAGYTDYLLARTAIDSYPVGAAAVLPCYWLYAEIGLKLTEFNHPDHTYNAWLTLYGDTEFIEGTKKSIQIVEDLMTEAGAAERERAIRAYLGACIWEREFFDQTSRMAKH